MQKAPNCGSERAGPAADAADQYLVVLVKALARAAARELLEGAKNCSGVEP
jgi:hypothetical protein